MWRLRVNCEEKGNLASNHPWLRSKLRGYMRLSPKVTSRRGLSEKGLAPKLIYFASTKGRSWVPLDLHQEVKRVCVLSHNETIKVSKSCLAPKSKILVQEVGLVPRLSKLETMDGESIL
jgi:hypothetical protein